MGRRARTAAEWRRFERERFDRRVPKLRRNRRRVERAQTGGCAKRMWRDLDEATIAAAHGLAHPDNPTKQIAIYVCSRCRHYHQSSRGMDWPNVVRVLEREPQRTA